MNNSCFKMGTEIAGLLTSILKKKSTKNFSNLLRENLLNLTIALRGSSSFGVEELLNSCVNELCQVD